MNEDENKSEAGSYTKENASILQEIEQDKKVRCLHKANIVVYAYRPHADLEDQTRETVIHDMQALHRYLPLSVRFASLLR